MIDAQALSMCVLRELLADIASVSAAVLGDFGLDVYWFLDHSRSEAAPETGLDTHPIARQHVSLAGAANVVHNLSALGCGQMAAYAVVGDDLWGHELKRQLGEIGVDTRSVVVQPQEWSTVVYVKPHVGTRELNRFDLGNFNRLDAGIARRVVDGLEARLTEHDVVLINEQVLGAIHAPEMQTLLTAMIARHPKKVFIADCRHRAGAYAGAYLKINEHEAVRLTNLGSGEGEEIADELSQKAAETLFRERGLPVFVTRGARGCVVLHDGGTKELAPVPTFGPIDTVGAGDSMLAGIGAALATGRDPVTSAAFGNLVASVTVRKLRTTGTASPAEILAAAEESGIR